MPYHNQREYKRIPNIKELVHEFALEVNHDYDVVLEYWRGSRDQPVVLADALSRCKDEGDIYAEMGEEIERCGGCGRDITGSTVLSPWGSMETWCPDCKEI